MVVGALIVMVISTCFQLYKIYLAITQLPPIIGGRSGSLASIFLTSSSYFLQSNSTPSERFSTLKVSGHANPPSLNHPPNIQKVSLGQVAPWSQLCQRWEHPAPTYSQAHSCCPGFPVKKFPKEIGQQVYQTSSWDVKLWSSGNISWRLVRTCHPSEQKHSPCLYTVLSTTIHSPWPCNMDKKRKLTPSRWFCLIAIIVGLAIGLVLTQVPNPPRLACAGAPFSDAMVTAHLARLWYSFVIL